MTLTLRPAQPIDAGATGAILAQFQEQTPWMPKLYSGAETIGFCGEMIDRGWVTVAVQAQRAIGFIARDQEEICALYVLGAAQNAGIGRCLLDDAMARCDKLWLRVFQANNGAQEFYARAGFGEAGRGDGTGNDENLPDICYVWQRESRK